MKSKKKSDVYFGTYSFQLENFQNHFSSADNEAVEVKWEIIEDDQEVEMHKPIDKDPLGIKNIHSFHSFSFLLRTYGSIRWCC
jgi:hypothetical protein